MHVSKKAYQTCKLLAGSKTTDDTTSSEGLNGCTVTIALSLASVAGSHIILDSSPGGVLESFLASAKPILTGILDTTLISAGVLGLLSLSDPAS